MHMPQSGREELINQIIRNHGEQAEAPAREVAQAYEDEIRRLENQYQQEARQIENTAARRDQQIANDIQTITWIYALGGIGLGLIAAVFAIFEFGVSDINVIYAGMALSIGSFVLSWA